MSTMIVIAVILAALVICPLQARLQWLAVNKLFDLDLNQRFVTGTSYVAFVLVDMAMMLPFENPLYALFGPHVKHGASGIFLFLLITVILPYVLRLAVMLPFYYYYCLSPADRNRHNMLKCAAIADIIPSAIMLLIYIAL